MQERVYETAMGSIRYWMDVVNADEVTLVFLPGLTADHRLFDKQIELFRGRFNLFVWDAPGHAASWPFDFDFSLDDKARWLGEILEKEGVAKPVIVGQSMGGYVAQAFMQRYPGRLAGFVSVDSAPLQRRYLTSIEI